MGDDKCPVDHSARGAWLKKSEGAKNVEETKVLECPVDHGSRSAWVNKVTVTANVEAEDIESTGNHGRDMVKSDDVNLSTERQISSIPRTDSNSNWIYPSQKQFYEAMKRKNWDPNAEDMNSVVPIHNIVNERTWRHIMNWEKNNIDDANNKCGGITLTSFKGDSKKLTPRAWFRSNILGQEKPFDRHDWIINRCGVQVEYVIDFYGNVNDSTVFLDVRPKLNHWEGIKLRVSRALGWD